MRRQSLTHFFPERIAWIGAALLLVALLLTLPFIWNIQKVDAGALVGKEKKERMIPLISHSFNLSLKDKAPGLSVPDLRDQMTFSFDPPRPDGASYGKRLLVRMNEGGESRRVVLPCRLDLEFQGNRLKFATQPSMFWMELSLVDGEIQGKGTITTPDGVKIDAGSFKVTGEDCPLQGAAEFPEGSPFRLLGEAKWWGKDQFRTGGHSGERLEIGSDGLLEISEGDWLIWKEGRWEKSEAPDKTLPIAHIQSVSMRGLVLEGWGAEGHTRLVLPSAVGPVFKIKGEDLFSSIRIRSEKQISCILEKQCMVLKKGDWVLKTAGRWKILRKKDERDAFLNGKLFGELFILEQISQKQGQKVIQGRLFNPGRTQVVTIELPAQAGRKMAEKHVRKGRSP